jgi:PilZ domain
MLLEVALDLDAEADAIEAQAASERRGYARLRLGAIQDALLHASDAHRDPMPVQVVNLSRGGAKLRGELSQTVGNNVTLELPCQGLHLDGTIVRVRGREASMVFAPVTSESPGLNSLLRTESATTAVSA